MDGDYVGDLKQLLQIMVEKGLANALERRCGGGEHCCRFQNISYVCSVFVVVYPCSSVCLFQTPFVQIDCFSLFCLCEYQLVSVLL